MTLRPEPVRGVPEETVAVARAAFPKGNLYMRLRDTLGAVYRDEQFADLYARSGGWAESPGRLALVQVMAYAENLTDRQAADAVRARIDWKYALGLSLSDPGFDFTVLCEFRQRLLASEAEQRLLEHLLEVFQSRGLLKAGGRQRTDSTHVLGAARDLNRLELVGETLRQALEAVTEQAPDWLRAWVPAVWIERYARRLDEYRLPKGRDERATQACVIGADGMALLERVYAVPLNEPSPAAQLRHRPAVEALRRIWLQQYEVREGAVTWRASGDLPPGAELIHSPIDLDVRYSLKRDTAWTGYKVCLTETCDPDTPNLIVQVQTSAATTPDVALLAPIQADLAAHQRLPAEHYVDSGFVDAGALVDSATQYGVQVVGPVQADTSWQARAGQGYEASAFAIDWTAQRVTCPQGQPSRTWSPSHDTFGNPVIHVGFARPVCAACPARTACTHAATRPRTLRLRSEAHHLALQAQRQAQATPEFQQRYAVRAGVEGTIAQVLTRTDARHARYLGWAKVHLQHICTAAAVDLVRVLTWLADIPKALTRMSHFAQLFPAPAPAL